MLTEIVIIVNLANAKNTPIVSLCKNQEILKKNKTGPKTQSDVTIRFSRYPYSEFS